MAITPTRVLRYETRDRKAYITLNRPEVMNALNFEIGNAIAEAVREFGNDNNLLVAIISGEGGRAFSAGMDLKETTQRDQGALPADRGRVSGARAAFDELTNCRKPVIAAIDGYCLAAGLEITICCDIRIATVQSRFGLPEARRSLIPGPGVQLSRHIPMGEALLILLGGGHVSAERMYQLGYIQRLVQDREALFKEADTIADEILQCAPLAVQALKRIIKVGHSLPVPVLEQMAEPIRSAIERTEDRREGPRAFVEKRPAVWKMR
ncbi:MAG TPA: enoyl-CoA hydratase-related protein [Candidatus Binataceae bacterium]|nr:enoyl-CoA hydratase-related protein [Candidatus Binataceae bacterium]